MKTMTYGFLAALCMFSSSAFAFQFQRLLTVNSEYFPGTEFRLTAVLEDDSPTLTGMQYQGDGRELHDFNITSLTSGPQVLVWDNDVTHHLAVVSLDASKIDKTEGGTLTIKYLYNGIWNTYNQIELELQREGDSWSIYSNDSGMRTKVTQMQMTNNTFFGRVIGIRSITFK